MTPGAVPVPLLWPGADDIHDRRWIHDSPGIASLAGQAPAEAEGTAGPAGAVAREQAREGATPERVAEVWTARRPGEHAGPPGAVAGAGVRRPGCAWGVVRW
ncbi:hypothetical protein [Streptomyces sp. NRRL S-646]|uniref:hypothetical protein n=1 Tax=Streptomyces sp. NRRL S-646 TaxID=1463917 RepID=UPI0004CB01EF|nr:hypothetical protein [Streptomyces sp. NRRL S-646]